MDGLDWDGNLCVGHRFAVLINYFKPNLGYLHQLELHPVHLGLLEQLSHVGDGETDEQVADDDGDAQSKDEEEHVFV